MSRAVAQSLGRIIVVAFILIGLLAVVTTARYASTRRVRRAAAGQIAGKPIKGDVRRGEDGKLQYFDGKGWTKTPPAPNDDSR